MTKPSLFIFALFLFFNSYAETFRVATWNILAQQAYKKYAFKKIKTDLGIKGDYKSMQINHGNKNSTITNKGEEGISINADELVMPWDKRKNLLEKQLASLSKEVDIICLQECDLRSSDWLIEKMKEFKFTCAFPIKGYLVSLVFYKEDKFTADNSYEIKIAAFDKDDKNIEKKDEKFNICISTTVTLKKNKKIPSIKIISIHRPTLKGQSLKNIEEDIMKHKYTEGFTIICGDFNYATIKIAYPDKKEKSQDYKDLITHARFEPNIWKNAFKKTNNELPTAYSASGYLEQIDYIFYTPSDPKKSNYQLDCIATQQIPHSELWEKFIKHRRRKELPKNIKNFSTFPSDHAILMAEFEIETEEEMNKRLLKSKKSNTKTIDAFAQGLYLITI